MELEPADILSLTHALDSGYAVIADLGVALAGTGKSLDDYSSDSDTKRIRIYKLVQGASKEGWTTLVLASVEQDRVNGRPRFQPGHPLLRETARLRALLSARAAEFGLPGGGDPADALIVFRRPFINRSTFRLDLTRFAHGNQSRVFAIQGPRSCGKSHSWYLIRHYCQAKGGANLALVDLSERDPGSCRPRDLMELLAGQMSLDMASMPADMLAQDARVDEKLTTWLCGQSLAFGQRNQNWWIGFDGLDRPQASQGVIDLVSRLALAIENGVLKNTWLFLFGFKDTLPTAIDSYVFREQLKGLDRFELRRYLRALVEARGGVIEDAALDRLVDFVFDALPDPLQPESMRMFGDRLRDIVQRL